MKQKLMIVVSILISQISFSQWVKMNSIQSASVSIINDSTMFFTGFMTGIYKSSNFGATYQSLEITKDLSNVSAVDVNNLWISTWEGKILYSSDGGNSWETQYVDSSKTTFINYVEMFDLSNGMAMGDGLHEYSPAVFLKTTDGGKNWISMNDSSFGAYSNDLWRVVQFVTPNVGYFFSNYENPTKLFKTTTGGKNWLPANYPSGWGGSVIKYYNENIGLVQCGFRNSMYRTTDGGVTWLMFTSPSLNKGEDIEFAPGNPSKVWFTDWRKIYFSSDTGRTWKEQASFMGRDIEFLSEMSGYVVGDSGILYTSNGGEIISGSGKEISDMYPKELSLSQNYPNPFNPTTTISYALPQDELVTLKIYDVLGREVSTLVNEFKQTGRYTVSLDATRLSSGLYIYKLVSGKFTATKKMMLVK